MIRDARTIADLYLENAATAAAASIMPNTHKLNPFVS